MGKNESPRRLRPPARLTRVGAVLYRGRGRAHPFLRDERGRRLIRREVVFGPIGARGSATVRVRACFSGGAGGLSETDEICNDSWALKGV